MKIKAEDIMLIERNKKISLPLFLETVPAGFPSPVEGFVDRKLDIHEYLVKKPEATFLVRASGDSMQEVGIFAGDLLVVDRSLNPESGDVVIAVVDGDLTVKTFSRKNGQCFLVPANSKYQPIKIDETMETTIWGVVCGVVRKM